MSEPKPTETETSPVPEKCSAGLTWGYHGWLLGFGITALFFGLLALAEDSEHFIYHIFVELAVAALTLLLTVVIVEKLLDDRRNRDRDEQWRVVRENTMMWLTAGVTSIVIQATRLIPDEFKTFHQYIKGEFTYSEVATPEGAKELDEIRALVWNSWLQSVVPPSGDNPGKSFSFDPKALLFWYRMSQSRFKSFRELVVPRMMQFSPNHPAMNAVLALEMAILSIDGLDSGLQLDPTAYSQLSGGAVYTLVQKASEVYALLARLNERKQ